MYVGVDIGGSKILVAASRDGQTINQQEKIETPVDGANGVAAIIKMIEKVAGEHRIKSIAVASAGPLDFKRGMIRATSPNMHGWRETHLIDPLREKFTVPVSLHLDGAAAAITEAGQGAGQGYRNVLYVTISTGIGASLVINGELYNGEHGIEIGHMIIDPNPNGPECGCGGRGHFEAFVSGPAIKRRFGKYGYEIFDPKIWDQIAADLAIGFHNLIVAYSPSIIVVGGGVGVHFDQFYDPLMKYIEALKPVFPTPPIIQAKNIETAVIYGALELARRADQS